MALFSLSNGFYYDSDQMILTKKPMDCHVINHEDLDPDFDNVCYSAPNTISGITIIPTLNCNLRCKYCMESSTSGNNDIDIGTVLSLLEECLVRNVSSYILKNKKKTSLFVKLTGGGEPTFNWPLFTSIVESVKHYCANAETTVTFSLVTNGFIEDVDKLDYLADNFEFITVSYDGLPEVQSSNRPSFRGIDSSTVVQNAIKHLAKKARKLKIQTTVTYSNLNLLNSMVDHLSDICNLKRIQWSINPVMPVGRGSIIDNNVLLSQDFFHSFKELLIYSKSKHDFTDIHSNALRTFAVVQYCDSIFNKEPMLFLYPDGSIFLCNNYRDVDCVATIINNKVVWASPFRNILLEEYEKKYKSRKCKECIAYRICKGGCPAQSLSMRNFQYVNWECEWRRSMWENVLERLCRMED